MKSISKPAKNKKSTTKRVIAGTKRAPAKGVWAKLRRNPKAFTSVVVAVLVVPTLLAYVFADKSYVLPATSMGNIYTQPAAVSMKKGDSVKLALRIEPGTPIDTVTVGVGYDSSELQYKSVSYAESPFSTQIPATSAPAKVTVQSAKFGGDPVSADSLVATLSFAALKDGTPRLVLSGNAARAGVATNPTLNGQAVTIDGEVLPKGATGGKIATRSAATSSSPAPIEFTKNLLEKLGLPEYRAASMAPILFITVAGGGLVAVGYFVYLVTMKRGLPKKGNIYKGGNSVSR
ncbi:hypothetical protein JNM87_02295 [Candidatus Saccharibacteria bacterium]|nr:hypothetical protein [Candidatus Saccharibacteria bacterium]